MSASVGETAEAGALFHTTLGHLSADTYSLRHCTCWRLFMAKDVLFVIFTISLVTIILSPVVPLEY